MREFVKYLKKCFFWKNGFQCNEWKADVIHVFENSGKQTIIENMCRYKIKLKRLTYKNKSNFLSIFLSICISLFVCLLTLLITTLNSMITVACNGIQDKIKVDIKNINDINEVSKEFVNEVVTLFEKASLETIISIGLWSILAIIIVAVIVIIYKKMKVEGIIFCEEMIKISEEYLEDKKSVQKSLY